MSSRHATAQTLAMLKLLMAVALVCLGALGLLILSPLLVVYGAVFDIPQLLASQSLAQFLGLALLILTVPLAGALGLASLTLDSLSSLLDARAGKRKRKRGAYISAREAFLRSLSRDERARLRQKLAAARLEIRDDGLLVPHESAAASCKLHNDESILPKDLKAR